MMCFCFVIPVAVHLSLPWCSLNTASMLLKTGALHRKSSCESWLKNFPASFMGVRHDGGSAPVEEKYIEDK